MRVIVTAKLNNETLMNVVCIAKSTEDAIKTVIKYSKRLLPDSNLYVLDESQIVNTENWETERISSDQSGKREYLVSFFMDKQAQNLTINANSVKSAYNNIRIKYGIQKDVLMFIYELNQIICCCSRIPNIRYNLIGICRDLRNWNCDETFNSVC